LKNLVLVLAVVCLFVACSKEHGDHDDHDGHDKMMGNSACCTPEQLKENEASIKTANDQFYTALNSMFVGELEPMNEIWSHGEYVTITGPFGGRLTGWDNVGAEFAKQSAMKFGGKVACDELHVYAGSDIGYTICVEKGENMSTEGKPVSVSHRATNVFHMEDGKWKMVHHHTDISPQLEAARGIQNK